MNSDPDKITFVCPLCHQMSAQSPALIQKRITCPHCDASVVCYASDITATPPPTDQNGEEIDFEGIEDEPIANAPLAKRKSRPGQFTVIRIMLWTTCVAVMLTLWRFRAMYETIAIWASIGFASLFGVFIIGASLAEARFIDRLMKIGIRTRGKVCRYQRHRRRLRSAVVRFRVGDRVFEIRKQHSRRVRHLPPIGSLTGVIYPPDSPEEGRIIPAGKSVPEDMTGVLILFGLSWIIAAAVAFFFFVF